MYTFLQQSPEVFLTSPKEPFFFCTDLHEESDRFHGQRLWFPVRTWRQYQSLYAGVKGQRIIGEATAVYLYSNSALGEIYKFNPYAKLLILLRNPVAFLVSLHNLFFSAGYERRGDLLEILSTGEEPSRKVLAFAPCPSFLNYRQWMRYHEHLRRCFQVWPKESVKVVLFEDFRQDNRKVVGEVAQWLGIDGRTIQSYRDVNVLEPGQPWGVTGFLYHPRVKALVRRWLPLSWHDRLWSLTRRVFWRKGKGSTAAKSELRQLLHQELQEVLGECSELLGRNLHGVWGEP
jgi:hypothetical protein